MAISLMIAWPFPILKTSGDPSSEIPLLIQYLPVIITALLLALLFAPLATYLYYGWAARRRQVLSLFPSEAVVLYYNAYFTADPKNRPRDQTGFALDFDKRYGRRHFFIPATVFFGLSIFLTFLCANSAAENLDVRASLLSLKIPPVMLAGVCSAYLWVLLDFILRERSLDFSTTHINHASFRLVMAVPLSFAIGHLAKDEVGFVLAFLIGFFPTEAIIRFLRRIASQRLQMPESVEDTTSRLDNLSSIDSTVADRFAQEGIRTISQLANTDPVSLTIRSGLPFSFVLDCLSEAISWYFLQKDGMAITKRTSLPGALEISGLVEELDYIDNPLNPLNERYKLDRNLAVETVQVVADRLSLPVSVVERIFRTIWNDSRTQFLATLWGTMQEVRVKHLTAGAL